MRYLQELTRSPARVSSQLVHLPVSAWLPTCQTVFPHFDQLIHWLPARWTVHPPVCMSSWCSTSRQTVYLLASSPVYLSADIPFTCLFACQPTHSPFLHSDCHPARRSACPSASPHVCRLAHRPYIPTAIAPN